MSFQAYIDNIKKSTGATPEDIKAKAIEDNILTPDLTATIFVEWLAKTYNLGRGHSMALWKYFVESNWINPKKTALK